MAAVVCLQQTTTHPSHPATTREDRRWIPGREEWGGGGREREREREKREREREREGEEASSERGGREGRERG